MNVVICLSHGGLEQGADGSSTDGEDVRLAKAVAGIDVVIGGHTYTEVHKAIMVNGHTPLFRPGSTGKTWVNWSSLWTAPG